MSSSEKEQLTQPGMAGQTSIRLFTSRMANEKSVRSLGIGSASVKQSNIFEATPSFFKSSPKNSLMN